MLIRNSVKKVGRLLESPYFDVSIGDYCIIKSPNSNEIIKFLRNKRLSKRLYKNLLFSGGFLEINMFENIYLQHKCRKRLKIKKKQEDFDKREEENEEKLEKLLDFYIIKNNNE